MSKPLPKFKKGDLVMYEGELYHISCQYGFNGKEYTYSMYKGDDPTAIYRTVYAESKLTLVQAAEEEVCWTSERVNDIAAEGKEILDLCVNIPHADKQEDGSVKHSVEHHIPLKDDNGDWSNVRNWDLPEDKTQFVAKHIDNARAYAKAYVAGEVGEGVDVLPPWLLFPHYTADTSLWYERTCGKYVEKWLDFLRGLSSSDFVSYQKRFPVPMFLSGTDYLGMNSLNKLVCGCDEEGVKEEHEDSAC